MLVLSRKLGESLWIGERIRLVVVRLEAGRVRLGIEAPGDVRVVREELDPLFCPAPSRSDDRVVLRRKRGDY